MPNARTDIRHCDSATGTPTFMISAIMLPSGRNPFLSKRTSLLKCKFIQKPTAAATACAITVAYAAPAIPMAGSPNHPKIMTGSSTIFTTAPASMETMVRFAFPVADKSLSIMTWCRAAKASTLMISL